MNIYLRNLHNVVKTYTRQAGRRSFWPQRKDPRDRVSISEEGRRLMEEMARRINNFRSEEQPQEVDKRLRFKVLDPENGKEVLEEISPERQGEILEKLVAKIMQERGEKR